MSDLSSFTVTKRWPASHPESISLYASPTPNGAKVSIMLEETGLPSVTYTHLPPQQLLMV